MSAVGKRSDGPFGWPIEGDDRVSAGLTHCVVCGHELQPKVADVNDGSAMLFAQCQGCRRIYVMDAMRYPELPR